MPEGENLVLNTEQKSKQWWIKPGNSSPREGIFSLGTNKFCIVGTCSLPPISQEADIFVEQSDEAHPWGIWKLGRVFPPPK